MSAQIRRGGQWIRPGFSYHEPAAGEGYPYESIQVQLLESLRNLAESELGTQTLTLQRIERLLVRIDRRLAADLPLRKARK